MYVTIKTVFLLPFSLFILMMMYSNNALAQDSKTGSAQEIVEQAFKRSDILNAPDVIDLVASLETHELRKGKELSRHHLRIRLFKEEPLTKVLARYSHPQAIEGTAYLSHIHQSYKKAPVTWLYLPTLGKTKRVSFNKVKKSLPGIGAGFSLPDKHTKSLDDYDYLQQQDELMFGKRYRVFELRPKSKKVDTYKLVWIEESEGFVAKVLTMDSSHHVEEELLLEAYKLHGTYWLPGVISRADIPSERTTKIVLKELDLNTGLGPEDFKLNSIEYAF